MNLTSVLNDFYETSVVPNDIFIDNYFYDICVRCRVHTLTLHTRVCVFSKCTTWFFYNYDSIVVTTVSGCIVADPNRNFGREQNFYEIIFKYFYENPSPKVENWQILFDFTVKVLSRIFIMNFNFSVI